MNVARDRLNLNASGFWLAPRRGGIREMWKVVSGSGTRVFALISASLDQYIELLKKVVFNRDANTVQFCHST